MKYRYDNKINRKHINLKTFLGLFLSPVFLIAGAYTLVLMNSPKVQSIPSGFSIETTEFENSTLDVANSISGDNKIVIPKIGVSVDLLTGTSIVMDTGAWHRFPERGNPEIGGNFIVSEHRFNLGWTPQQTRARSPFYNIDQIIIGDFIYADYNGKRYTYEVKNKFFVKPEAVYIEAPTSEAKLTMYSCSMKGSQDGREVIEATLTDQTPVAFVAKSRQL